MSNASARVAPSAGLLTLDVPVGHLLAPSHLPRSRIAFSCNDLFSVAVGKNPIPTRLAGDATVNLGEATKEETPEPLSSSNSLEVTAASFVASRGLPSVPWEACSPGWDVCESHHIDVMPNRVFINRFLIMLSGNPYEFQNNTRNPPPQAVWGTFRTSAKVNGHSRDRKGCVYTYDCWLHDLVLSILSTLCLQA